MSGPERYTTSRPRTQKTVIRIVFSIELHHEKRVGYPFFVRVSSNITVFEWSRTNKWAEFRVLMSQLD
uniref:Uncharacterized protein n=1 Tax=Caenorhabditis japonica TaxID=281687 RepID=A0A8R1ID88_CAEJA